MALFIIRGDTVTAYAGSGWGLGKRMAGPIGKRDRG